MLRNTECYRKIDTISIDSLNLQKRLTEVEDGQHSADCFHDDNTDIQLYIVTIFHTAENASLSTYGHVVRIQMYAYERSELCSLSFIAPGRLASRHRHRRRVPEALLRRRTLFTPSFEVYWRALSLITTPAPRR